MVVSNLRLPVASFTRSSSNFSFCAVPGLGSLHIYSGALQPMPTHKPLMLFVPLFLHLTSGIIQANAPRRFYHRTIIPWVPLHTNAKCQSKESWLYSDCSSHGFYNFYSTIGKEICIYCDALCL